MSTLVMVLLILAAVGGTGVVFSRRPERQVMAISANGLVLTLLFMVLQAPDVAFSELAVGAVAVPLMFLVVLASIRMDRKAPIALKTRSEISKP
jgi:energy-converting hydrogenase B subunit D